MKTLHTTFLIVFLLITHSSFSQQFSTSAEYCSYYKSHSPHVLLAGDKLIEVPHSFNVLDYNLHLDIYSCFQSPYPKSFTAVEIITFRVDSSLNSIQMDAVNSSLIIDSVRMSAVSFNHNNDLLSISLNRTYQPGETTGVKIYYRHKNVADNAFYNYSGSVYTDCEPEGARMWFPCWDKPSDKATVDLTIKVASNVPLGSNGRLADSLVIGDSIYYHWVSGDPMSTYLVALTGNASYYLDIVYWHKISNPADSVPIRFYYGTWDNQDSVNKIKNIIVPMTDFYSTIFCEHPFEKNGFASINYWNGGAMENQTLTFLHANAWYSYYYIPHEFAHQWFGDLITCGTWADIWLNEGFATYCESLWEEHIKNYSAYKANVIRYANYYLASAPSFPIYDPPAGQLFNFYNTYCKSSCVLHLLRYTIGDSVFFNLLKSYAADTTFMFKSAVTADFVSKVNSITGQDYNWFFNEWIFQPYYPKYQNTYSIFQIDSSTWKVNFVAKQVQTNPSFFKMPIELKFNFGAGDTVVDRVMNDANNQLFEFTFNRRPLSLVFDPYNNIVLKTATTAIGIENTGKEIPHKYALYHNYPNPFNSTTAIKFDLPKAGQTKIVIYNIQGREVDVLVNQKLDAGSYKTQWVADNYPSGVYFFRIESGEFKETKKMVLVK
jgi:aminopeptidase N